MVKFVEWLFKEYGVWLWTKVVVELGKAYTIFFPFYQLLASNCWTNLIFFYQAILAYMHTWISHFSTQGSIKHEIRTTFEPGPSLF